MGMEIIFTLMERKKEILERWFEMIISIYQQEAITFIKTEKDRFLNPIGATISEGIDVIYDFIVEGKDKTLAIDALESIIKIMVLEDLNSDQIGSIMLHLKEILNEEEEKYRVELGKIQNRIDEMIRLTFDIYMKCKENIERIRIKEFEARHFKQLYR